MTRRLEHLGPNIRSLAANLVLDTHGTVKREDIEIGAQALAPRIAFGRVIRLQ